MPCAVYLDHTKSIVGYHLKAVPIIIDNHASCNVGGVIIQAWINLDQKEG